jgi:hypothetical protein
MPFSLYLKKASFNPKNTAVREAAFNAHIRAINQLRGDINSMFGMGNWVVLA